MYHNNLSFLWTSVGQRHCVDLKLWFITINHIIIKVKWISSRLLWNEIANFLALCTSWKNEEKTITKSWNNQVISRVHEITSLTPHFTSQKTDDTKVMVFVMDGMYQFNLSLLFTFLTWASITCTYQYLLFWWDWNPLF